VSRTGPVRGKPRDSGQESVPAHVTLPNPERAPIDVSSGLLSAAVASAIANEDLAAIGFPLCDGLHARSRSGSPADRAVGSWLAAIPRPARRYQRGQRRTRAKAILPSGRTMRATVPGLGRSRFKLAASCWGGPEWNSDGSALTFRWWGRRICIADEAHPEAITFWTLAGSSFKEWKDGSRTYGLLPDRIQRYVFVREQGL
jgi:hypothetical protein